MQRKNDDMLKATAMPSSSEIDAHAPQRSADDDEFVPPNAAEEKRRGSKEQGVKTKEDGVLPPTHPFGGGIIRRGSGPTDETSKLANANPLTRAMRTIKIAGGMLRHNVTPPETRHSLDSYIIRHPSGRLEDSARGRAGLLNNLLRGEFWDDSEEDTNAASSVLLGGRQRSADDLATHTSNQHDRRMPIVSSTYGLSLNSSSSFFGSQNACPARAQANNNDKDEE